MTHEELEALVLSHLGTNVAHGRNPQDISPDKLYKAKRSFNALGTGGAAPIVGTGADAPGSTAGSRIVKAVQGYVIVPLIGWMDFTFVTAAYTGGGNQFFSHRGNNLQFSEAAAFSLGLGGSGSQLRHIDGISAGGSLIANADLMFKCAAEITQPGTAAGTMILHCWYRLLRASD